MELTEKSTNEIVRLQAMRKWGIQKIFNFYADDYQKYNIRDDVMATRSVGIYIDFT